VEANLAIENDVFGQQLKKKKRGRVWRMLGLTALTLFGAGAGYFGFTKAGQDFVKTGRDAVTVAVSVRSNPNLIFDNAKSDHVNILLIGRDTNWKETKVYDPTTKTMRRFHVHDESAQARSDTMIVVSLDKNRKAIRMVSLPRDATIHMPENEFGVRRAKLNAAHSYGGPAMLIKTLHDELGITIHHYAVIKFDGFKKLIDQVGGVTVNVDGALKRHHRTGKLYRGNIDYDDNYGNLHIHLKPGVQRLNGQTAHDYVRFRMDLEGDPGRIRRQQAVMRALAKEIMHQSPLQIPGMIKEVRRQFETTLNDEQIGSAAFFAKGIGDASKIQPLTLFGSYGRRGSVVLNKPKNEKLMAVIFGSTFNPDNFLQNSPYTESGDEIGELDNKNESVRALLREAGLIKDDRPRHAESGSNASTTVAEDSSPVEGAREERSQSQALPTASLTVTSNDAPAVTAAQLSVD
jgi:LCP family protein required for cell wall assembly